MIGDIDKYVIDSSDNVYKRIDKHLLKLSPCHPSQKYVKEMDGDNFRVISYNNACMIVNKQYDAIDETWFHDGKNYIAKRLNIETRDDIEEHTHRIRLLPNHHIVLDDNGPSELKLIKHKGKMYYILLINERLPRVKAYDLFGRFVQWIGIQHCKDVFCKDDEIYI